MTNPEAHHADVYTSAEFLQEYELIKGRYPDLADADVREAAKLNLESAFLAGYGKASVEASKAENRGEVLASVDGKRVTSDFENKLLSLNNDVIISASKGETSGVEAVRHLFASSSVDYSAAIDALITTYSEYLKTPMPAESMLRKFNIDRVVKHLNYLLSVLAPVIAGSSPKSEFLDELAVSFDYSRDELSKVLKDITDKLSFGMLIDLLSPKQRVMVCAAVRIP